MQRASNLFNEEQRKHIEEAVIEAEAKTSCEIVPVVATVSGRYDRPEDMIGLWLAVFAAITVWLIFPRQSNESGSWEGMPFYVGLLTMVAGVVVAFIVGVVAGSQEAGVVCEEVFVDFELSEFSGLECLVCANGEFAD